MLSNIIKRSFSSKLPRQFGKHMIVDFKGSDNVDCPETIQRFVDDIVSDLKMTKY